MSLDTFLWILGSVIFALVVIGLIWWYGKSRREEEVRRFLPLPNNRVLSKEEIQHPFGHPVSTTRLQPATASVQRIRRQPVVTVPASSGEDSGVDIDLDRGSDDAVEATAAGARIIGAAVAGVAAAVATAGETGDPAICQSPDATTEKPVDDDDEERPQSGGSACAVANDSGSVGNDSDPVGTPD